MSHLGRSSWAGTWWSFPCSHGVGPLPFVLGFPFKLLSPFLLPEDLEKAGLSERVELLLLEPPHDVVGLREAVQDNGVPLLGGELDLHIRTAAALLEGTGPVRR